MCQEKLAEIDEETVHQKNVDLQLNSKKKKKTYKHKRARESDDSADEAENSADEAARDRAATFTMSIGEKRAYEQKRKLEREYAKHFKVVFVSVVGSHLLCQSPAMKVLDMTIDPTAIDVEEVKKTNKKKKKLKKARTSVMSSEPNSTDALDI